MNLRTNATRSSIIGQSRTVTRKICEVPDHIGMFVIKITNYTREESKRIMSV